MHEILNLYHLNIPFSKYKKFISYISILNFEVDDDTYAEWLIWLWFF